MKVSDQVGTFVLRRAFRAGKVVRNDVLIAFEGAFKQVRASQLLSDAVTEYPTLLTRSGTAVVPHPDAAIPEIASEQDLMANLFTGATRVRDTGLYERELPIQRVQWVENRPQQTGAFLEIVRALIQRKCLQIEYVSLRPGEKGKTRILHPVGLQVMADQWRLIAYDLKKAQPTQQAFVLARIRFAKMLEQRANKTYRHYSFESTSKIPVEINTSLTEAQQITIAHELRLHNGRVELPMGHTFEFFRRFGDGPVSDAVIWPLIKQK